ncbi:MAG: hypothetical protein ACR2O4_03795 [Hyphomicrobiaceae bacterium]
MTQQTKPDPADPWKMLEILTEVRNQAALIPGSDELLEKLDRAMAQLRALYGLKPDGRRERRH